jgi:hypothetical protein
MFNLKVFLQLSFQKYIYIYFDDINILSILLNLEIDVTSTSIENFSVPK